jgi:hypothetical protein
MAIRDALITFNSKPPPVVIEIQNVALSGSKLKHPGQNWLKNSIVGIKCVTHVDKVSDKVLWHQLQQIERANPGMAIFALNMGTANKMQRKQMRMVHEAVFKAVSLAGVSRAVVCGLPNSGKSSVILPLTKEETMVNKKKKATHLPKISSKAGMTLGIKEHRMCSKPSIVFLTDTPGIRHKLEVLDEDYIALLVASSSTEMTKDTFDATAKELADYSKTSGPEKVLRTLLRALNRHAAMSGEPPAYVKLFGLEEECTFVSDFIDAFNKKYKASVGTGASAGHSFKEIVHKSRSGELGGMVFTELAPSSVVSGDKMPRFDRSKPVVWCNTVAKQLAEGSYKLTAAKEREKRIDKRAV